MRATKSDRACSVVISFPFSQDPFMHAQPTNGLLAARDYAGTMTPQRCMKEAADA